LNLAIAETEATLAFDAIGGGALASDPNNVRALMGLGNKFFMSAVGGSGDRKGDLERADELESRALALDPDWTVPHEVKGNVLRFQALPGSRRRARARARH
jgi:hypothetical protein